MTLQRLVLTPQPDGLEIRVLYRTKASPSEAPNPGTKARRREATALVRPGLEQALEALEEGLVESIGTSGFETREDTLSAQTSEPREPGERSTKMSNAREAFWR